jgi:hypothetical protein
MEDFMSYQTALVSGAVVFGILSVVFLYWMAALSPNSLNYKQEGLDSSMQAPKLIAATVCSIISLGFILALVGL